MMEEPWFLPDDDLSPQPVRLDDARDWRAAQSGLAVKLARAAQALGALEATLDGDVGMIRRLALAEVEQVSAPTATKVARSGR